MEMCRTDENNPDTAFSPMLENTKVISGQLSEIGQKEVDSEGKIRNYQVINLSILS